MPSQLREARRQLMNRGSLPPDLIQPELARSWLRSWEAGLQPCGRLPGAPHASGAQLARALELQCELVAHARPVMEFVFEQTRGTDSMVILAGADGTLLATFSLSAGLNGWRCALAPPATSSIAAPMRLAPRLPTTAPWWCMPMSTTWSAMVF